MTELDSDVLRILDDFPTIRTGGGHKHFSNAPNSGISLSAKARTDNLGGQVLTLRETRHLTNLIHQRRIRAKWKVDFWKNRTGSRADDFTLGQFSTHGVVPMLEFAPGASRYIVMHELIHAWEYRRLIRQHGPQVGKAIFEGAGTNPAITRIDREQFVFDAIRKRPRLWDSLTDLEKVDARMYIESVGGVAW